jgi:hypothetical protein
MFDFVQSTDYRSPTVSGLCFAVLVNELPKNKGYNLEIFFNDQIPEGNFQGLVSQIVEPYDPFINNPDLVNFNKYT